MLIEDLCASMSKVDDPTDNLPKVLMMTTPMIVEVGKVVGNDFTTL